ncbi:MAG TPA: ergothioneine biosynthesis glutamate--cysteine ligase EgtA [Streptosporangiaceae bacterium]|nr:ergothioneine biosynthesis glutamate--cysteine ligase EgtA [Streptosporangiaceae bacterium]
MIQLPVDTSVAGQELSETDAEKLIGAICFKTGPPGTIGAELEWLVTDVADVSATVPIARIQDVLSDLERPAALPGEGLLTLEPGGQVELSTAPATGLDNCVTAASADMTVLHETFSSAGLILTGHGLDPARPPRRVLELPRYAAMEEYFDRRGPWGRLMMCNTASVQVCVDAGLAEDGTSGYPFRWRLLHALGPVLVAAFANSPLRLGRPTGWKCTRQLIWSRLDPCRTHAPPGAEPREQHAPSPRRAGQAPLAGEADPRDDWVRYALDAEVLCLRRPDGKPWTVPAGLTFRGWLHATGQPRPTVDDLSYHLSTLFPPVRAHGHLELRMIDAQPGDGWIVPVAVVAALIDDPVAADAAMAATEPVWGVPVPRPRRASRSGSPARREDAFQAGRRAASSMSRSGLSDGPWLRAARLGPADPAIARAIRECFEAAAAALARAGTSPRIRKMVGDFTERYVDRGRCPADDMLEELS